ncbi:MAG: terpene cyclase/mutase family protein [Phycisphaerales bacterium]|nr:terpene cyclase/mutase family protein [Phycisphaerales bacterium]
MPELLTPQAQQAIQRGTEYLISVQNTDGSWRSRTNMGAYPCALTSLAGLALMAGGHTPVEGEYSPQLRKAVQYVLSCANPTGLIARIDEEQRPMFGHGFALLFLSQAYGMERDPVQMQKIRTVLEKGIELTVRSQSRDGGWLYTPDANGDEGAVTVTQIQGLRACRNVGLEVPKSTIDRALGYIEKSVNPDGGIRYTARDRGPSRPPITAAAVATLYNAGAYENPVAERCLAYIKRLLQTSRGGTSAVYAGHEYYAILYTGQAMYLSSEANWQFFFPNMRDELVSRQSTDGSWNGDGVGQTYGTAIALLTLQLPYKYLPILQR